MSFEDQYSRVILLSIALTLAFGTGIINPRVQAVGLCQNLEVKHIGFEQFPLWRHFVSIMACEDFLFHVGSLQVQFPFSEYSLVVRNQLDVLG